MRGRVLGPPLRSSACRGPPASHRRLTEWVKRAGLRSCTGVPDRAVSARTAIRASQSPRAGRSRQRRWCASAARPGGKPAGSRNRYIRSPDTDPVEEPLRILPKLGLTAATVHCGQLACSRRSLSRRRLRQRVRRRRPVRVSTPCTTRPCTGRPGITPGTSTTRAAATTRTTAGTTRRR